MSHSDKILKTLKENPALSSKQIWEKIGGKTYCDHRTVQRKLKELHTEGLIETHSIGREIVYSLRSTTTASSNYFLDRFWTEFFLINEILHDPRRGGAGKAFSQLHSLVAMLPKDLKESLEPEFKQILSNKEKHTGELGFIYLGEREKPTDWQVISDNEKIMTALIDKVSSVVHERFSASFSH